MILNKSNSLLNILILGLGGVGYYLAKRLSHDDYAVTAIESSSHLIRIADQNMDARLIHGSAMSIECWKEADAGSADILIAVTDNDAINMLSSLIAERFGIPLKVARVRSLDFSAKDSVLGMADLNIDLIIHPEELVAQEIVRLIQRTAGNEIIEIADGQMRGIATRIHNTSPLAHQKLKDISRAQQDFPFRAVALARGITTILPGGDHELLPQDQVFFIAGRDDLPRLMALIGVKQERRHRVMILGGGLVSSRVAELLGKNVHVKIIEKDKERAEELSFQLAHTEVLHGDGSDAAILEQAGLTDMDTFITTTGENDTNIMSCLLGKHLMSTENSKNKNQDRKTICLCSKEEHMVLAATSGSDIALNKKILAGNEILKFIRRGELLSVIHLHGFDAEVVELVAAAGSPITRKPLSQLDPSYYGKILVGGIFRDGKWQTAVGDTQINENERAIVFCKSLQLKNVQRLFLG